MGSSQTLAQPVRPCRRERSQAAIAAGTGLTTGGPPSLAVAGRVETAAGTEAEARGKAAEGEAVVVAGAATEALGASSASPA